MGGVLFLFVAGILIGGVDVVDRRRDKLWFIAQSFCGPVAFAADFVSQRNVTRIPETWRDSPWERQYTEGDEAARARLRGTSLGKVNEIGTLYVALAGLMNLVVILDALHGAPSRGRESEPDAETGNDPA
jgi:hypothetical protein